MEKNPKKLIIEAYSKPGLEQKDFIDSMSVQLNPENFSRSYQVEFAKKQSPGSSSNQLKFSKIKPQKLELELMFDETGAVDGKTGSDLGVDKKINDLKKLALGYNGDAHRTNYLKIRWGNLLFKGALEALDVSYKVFNADGTPLRATAKATFVEFEPNDLMVKKQNDQSPDITHVRQVKEGDTLPLLSYEIYGDSKYYLEVARVNEIYDFRTLEAGTTIYFPPIEK